MFCHFRPLFDLSAPLTTRKIKILKLKKASGDITILHICIINDDNHMMYGSWDMERNRQNYLPLWTVFSHLPPLPNNPKNLNFEKMKKTPGDNIILHMCTINDNHMMYRSWDTKRNGQNFLLFWTIFYPFTPITTQKIKILKKWKNGRRHYHFTHVYHKWKSYYVWFLRYGAWRREFYVILDNFLPFYPPKNPKIENFEKLKRMPGDIIILHKCPKNHDHMLHCSWDMACDGCNCYFSFWAIFCLSNSPKIKISQKWKQLLEISSFYTCAPKIMIWWCTIPEIWCTTDGQMEKVTHRGGCTT